MPLTKEIRARRKQGCLSVVRYRIPMQVTKVMVLTYGGSYPICPRCNCSMDREYMNFCDRCGQHLGWELFGFAQEVNAPRKHEKG